MIGALADLGYALGRNLALEARGAMGDIAKLPGLVEQLRTAGAQILVAQGYPAAVVGKDAGMPTVIFTGAGDPVATGLVASWAHPGGVVTGISDLAPALTIKRLELLKALSPGMKRVAMLWNQDDRAMTLRYRASADTAKIQGVAVQPLDVREPDDVNGAFAATDRDAPDAILMMSNALTREQGVVLEHDSDAAALGRQSRDVARSMRTSPRVGSTKPAIMRSVVVLPQPEGPSSERNSPVSHHKRARRGGLNRRRQLRCSPIK